MAKNINGIYAGQVVSIKDPEHRGRIKVKISELLGESTSNWCEPCVPCCFDNGGDFCLPKLKDFVWVTFMDGDLESPVYLGGWWSKDSSPLGKEYSEASKSRIISFGGMRIEFNSTNNTVNIISELDNNTKTLSISPKELLIDGKPISPTPQTDIKIEKVWEVHENNEPIYSSPIVKDNKVVYQSWDWFGYVRNLSDGSLDFKRPFSDSMYGSAVCEDINNDGYLEYIFVSHAGEIRCYSHDNVLLWSQSDEFSRAIGTCVCESETDDLYVLKDSTKNYAKGFGIRNIKVPNENANVVINGEYYSVHEIDGTTIKVLKNQSNLKQGGEYSYSISPAYSSDRIFQHAGTLNKENNKWYLYITGMDFCLRKIDCLTGEILWVYSSHEASEPYPFIADLGNGINVFFVSVDWFIYCLDLNGNLLWNCPLNGGIDSFTTMITLSNGEKNLVVSCRDGCIYRVSKDGDIKAKTVNTQADIDCRPVVYDFNEDGKQEIICGGDSGFIYCFDENLKTLWRTNIGTYLNSSGVIADINYDGKMEVLWGDMGGTITILNPLDGTILHQIYESGSVEGTPAIGDFDNDNLIEMVVTACDGTIKLYRFMNS